MSDRDVPDIGRRLDPRERIRDVGPIADVRAVDPRRLLDPRPRLVDPLIDAVVRATPDAELAAGSAGEPITVSAESLPALVIAALGGRETPRVVWQNGLAEVIVHLDRTRVVTRPGFVIVALVLENEQVGAAEVTVVLAVGRRDTPPVLAVTAEAIPHGPPDLVDGWGRAVVAAVVTAVVTMAADIAAARGRDQRGLPLLPAAITADKDGLHIVPRARLDIEEDAR